MSQPKSQNEEFKSDQTISEAGEKGEHLEKGRDQGFTMPVPNHFIDQKEACLAG